MAVKSAKKAIEAAGLPPEALEEAQEAQEAPEKEKAGKYPGAGKAPGKPPGNAGICGAVPAQRIAEAEQYFCGNQGTG